MSIKGESTDSDMVKTLNKVKFKPAEIGKFLGIKTSNVTARLTVLKKKTKKKDVYEKNTSTTRRKAKE